MPIRTPVDVPEEISSFFSALNKLQQKYQEKILLSPIDLSKMILKESLSRGKTVLTINPIQVDSGLYREIFQSIEDLLLLHRPELKEAIRKIWEIEEQINFSELAKKTMELDHIFLLSLAAEKGLNFEILSFLSERALRPYLRVYALMVAGLFEEHLWKRDYCPICGHIPSIARISTQDGIRFLHCEHCASDWSYPRLSCIYCGNEDHKKLHYFMVEEDEGYQVHLCEACGGYIKIFDERVIGSQKNWEDLDLETLYLDVIAQQRGYLKSRNKGSLH